MLESNDLQGLLLEEISKKQALTDNKLTDDLVEIKDLISTLTTHSQEHNDIQLEYQKLHERLLHKIVEKQVELEEVR